MSPSSDIASYALLDVGTRRSKNVLNEVPASDHDLNNGDIHAILVLKSSKLTPTVAATPPPCASANA